MFSLWIPLSVKFESFLLDEVLNHLAVSRKPEDTFFFACSFSFPSLSPIHPLVIMSMPLISFKF